MKIVWLGFATGDNFVPNSGSYDASNRVQTGTLTIKSPAVTGDETYTCVISSIQHTESDEKSFDVKLDTYSKKIAFLMTMIINILAKRKTHVDSTQNQFQLSFFL